MTNSDSLYFSSSEISKIHFKVFTSQKGIRQIFMNKRDAKVSSASLINLHYDDPFMFNVFEELEEYFAGNRKKFAVPLDMQGTEFQIKVWKELLKIPFGKTISYKTLSERLGSEKLIRAVGKANGANPLPIIIPCHRVINTSGSLGGYSAGLKIKEKLLELEGCLSPTLFENFSV